MRCSHTHLELREVAAASFSMLYYSDKRPSYGRIAKALEAPGPFRVGLCLERDILTKPWRQRPGEEMKKRIRGGGAGSGCFRAS
jgi:hypothetical protein